jgi:hypothetical protein
MFNYAEKNAKNIYKIKKKNPPNTQNKPLYSLYIKLKLILSSLFCNSYNTKETQRIIH